jgi:hypothetical protein
MLNLIVAAAFQHVQMTNQVSFGVNMWVFQ